RGAPGGEESRLRVRLTLAPRKSREAESEDRREARRRLSPPRRRERRPEPERRRAETRRRPDALAGRRPASRAAAGSDPAHAGRPAPRDGDAVPILVAAGPGPGFPAGPGLLLLHGDRDLAGRRPRDRRRGERVGPVRSDEAPRARERDSDREDRSG